MTVMSEASILGTTKHLLGIDESETAFDIPLIAGINSAFMSLHQLGVGPIETPFSISDDTATWGSFDVDFSMYQALVMYVGFKARLSFDPPTISFVLTSLEKQISELESRLQTQSEVLHYVPPTPTTDEEGV